MHPEYECMKKDKRLLVLLALGVLILLRDLDFAPSGGSNSIKLGGSPSWLEFQGSENSIYRLHGTESIQEISQGKGIADLADWDLVQEIAAASETVSGTAMAWKRVSPAQTRQTSVSPRLAFFLGMPFSINSATADDLILVQGIGPALAENIIRYRQENGSITSQDELENVHGIGPKMRRRLHGLFTYANDGE